jgi:translation initiation factor IF-2
MAKITVEAAAKRLGMEPEECLKRLQEMGIMVRDQLDKVDTDVFQRVKARLEDEKMRAKTAAAAESKRIDSRVIRRRRVKDEEGAEAPAEAEAAPAPETHVEAELPAPAEAAEETAPAAEAHLSAEAVAEAEEAGAAEAAAAPTAEAAPASDEEADIAAEGVAPAEDTAAEAVPLRPFIERPSKGRRAPAVETLKPKKIKLHETTKEPAKILSRPTIPLEPLKPVAGAKPAEAPGTTPRPATDADQRERKGRRVVDFGDHGRRRKEEEAEIGFMRKGKQTKKKREIRQTEITTPKAIKRKLKIADQVIVGDLAKRMGVKSGDIIKKLMSLGMLVTINQTIDYDSAAIVASDFGFEPERSTVEEEDILKVEESKPENLAPRPPVVTVMGHVDHGKTTLLDAIRHTDVASGEAGGITQRIGAYNVRFKDGRMITFVDTPGHESFAAMRARGAQVTDIVILVVAADDGVMPQTVESINHAKEAGVPIVVAVNKIDKDNANPEKITTQLMEYALVPERLGGETLYAYLSAKKRQGIEELLESVLLQAEMMDLKADPQKPAAGVILDARLERGRGPVVDVILKEGTLRRGDLMVADVFFGRVRMLFDDKGQPLNEVTPGMPAQVIGLAGIPRAGMLLTAVEDEKVARQVTTLRTDKARSEELKKRANIRLEDLYAKAQEGAIKELKVIVKCDVHGSAEAVRDALLKLGTEDLKVKVIHTGVGPINETDVNFASASEAIIIGFNVKPEGKAKESAETQGVEIKLYSVIYELIEEVKLALVGMLEPTFAEVVNGVAEVRNTFRISKIGMVAGCYVLEGKIVRGSRVRLYRNNELVFTGQMGSLKRFKDDAKEVASGFECGISLEGHNDVQPGDRIESFNLVEQQPTL